MSDSRLQAKRGRFRLRTLFILTLVFAVICGYASWLGPDGVLWLLRSKGVSLLLAVGAIYLLGMLVQSPCRSLLASLVGHAVCGLVPTAAGIVLAALIGATLWGIGWVLDWITGGFGMVASGTVVGGVVGIIVAPLFAVVFAAYLGQGYADRQIAGYADNAPTDHETTGDFWNVPWSVLRNRFQLGMIATVYALGLANVASYYLRSEGVGTDGFEQMGFPLVVWGAGGFVYTEYFHWPMLVLNFLIALAAGVAGGTVASLVGDGPGMADDTESPPTSDEGERPEAPGPPQSV